MRLAGWRRSLLQRRFDGDAHDYDAGPAGVDRLGGTPETWGTQLCSGSARAGRWMARVSVPQRSRRITPIPEGWDQLPDSELQALWEVAERVAQSGSLP